MVNLFQNDFLTQRNHIICAYLKHRRPTLFFNEYNHLLKRIIIKIWEKYIDDNDLALLAIGGFGRAEVYPYSDLDLAVVSLCDLNNTQQQQISLFVQALWDMKLVPAVKSGSIEELLQSVRVDLSAQTAFLEARFLCGSSQIGLSCIDKMHKQLDIALFIESKLLEMQQRHRKQAALVLEPEIKNGMGGLRDIHTMLWLAKAQGLAINFQELVKQNVLSRTEASLIIRSHQELARLRIELHIVSKRAQDRLLFDVQGILAKSRYPEYSPQAGSEKLMAVFYRAVKTVLQLNGIIIPMLRTRFSSSLPRIVNYLDEHYYILNNHIAIKNLNLFIQQPEHLFRILEIVQQRSDLQGLAPKTLRAWWHATRSFQQPLSALPIYRQQFIYFFKTGDRLTYLMRHLNLYGVMGYYLPQWKKIVGLMQHDLFHIYPVDDHILAVLANIRRFAVEKYSHELPFASQLMRDFEPKYILYLAALFHDIAKGRNGDHALEGAQDARIFAQQHQLIDKDAELLIWLVQTHLLMSHTAQKEDFQDVMILKRFCDAVQNQQRLTALYLLTVADIRGTNPEIWNSWKAQLLERLFRAAARYMADDYQDNNKIDSAQMLLQQYGIENKVFFRLRAALGEAYFARHSEHESAWHLPLLARNWQQAQVHLRHLDNEIWQILVFMPNKSRLFTRLCRIFSRYRLDIVSARALVSAHNFIIDTFTVQLPSTYVNDALMIEHNLLMELTDFVENGIFREIQHNQSISRRAKHLPIAPYIKLKPDGTQKNWYLLEVVAINRTALLADITEVFAVHQISLQYAKITTLSDRVEDSFIICSDKLINPSQELALKRDLMQICI